MRILVVSHKPAGSEDEELLLTAERWLAFEEGRDTALSEVEEKVMHHAGDMEHVADAAEAKLLDWQTRNITTTHRNQSWL